MNINVQKSNKQNPQTQALIKQLSDQIRPEILYSCRSIHSVKRWPSPSSNPEYEPDQTKLTGHKKSFMDVGFIEC